MVRNLRSIFGKPKPRIIDLRRYDGVAYVIGDVHGSLSLLKGLEQKIAADAQEECLLICIGDMIDRGPDSFGVIEHVMAPLPGFRRICLMGNHEEMMLKFIGSPDAAQAWLGFGGKETLISYGALESEIRLAQTSARKMKALMERVIPPKHIEFLRALPHAIQLNEFVVAHAGGNPALPIAQQSVQDLLWGARNFSKTTPRYGKTIVHGHTTIEKAAHSAGKVAIDTGAYTTGKLTAVKLRPEKTVEFISFSEP